MRVCCPVCGSDYPIEAGLLEDDGKRLAAELAGMDPALGRAALAYLRLFKPPKTRLRMGRAVALARELNALVATGTVCRDERTGVHRPATPALWAAGIEQMVNQRDRLTLPLGSHGYLREVVYGLADKADAAAEQARETALRGARERPAAPVTGPSPPRQEDPLINAIKYAEQMIRLGQLSADEGQQLIDQARRRHGDGAGS